MLVPLTRETVQQLIPVIATGAQYAFYWGKVRDLLRKLLISLIAVLVIWILGNLLGEAFAGIKLILYIIAGLYWLWSPVYWASVRNGSYRKLPYGGFWRGRVLDAYITEEMVREEQTVNKFGELVVIENRERRINIEVGDQTGFSATAQAPLRRIHKVIKPGQIAEMLVLSKKPDLSTINHITDVHLPQHNLWIGEYPWLRRDLFVDISEELGGKTEKSPPPRRRPSQIKRRRY